MLKVLSRKILIPLMLILTITVSLCACTDGGTNETGNNFDEYIEIGIYDDNVLIEDSKTHNDEEVSENVNEITDFEVVYSNMNVKSVCMMETIVHTADIWSNVKHCIPGISTDDEFDEEFFIRNSLLVYVLGCENLTKVLEDVKLVVKDNVLYVELQTREGLCDAVTGWAVVISVRKFDLMRVRDVQLSTDFVVSRTTPFPIDPEFYNVVIEEAKKLGVI